jgi:stress-induced morphogen
VASDWIPVTFDPDVYVQSFSIVMVSETFQGMKVHEELQVI